MASTDGIAISLFSGAGGLDLGAENAGFDVRAAAEHDRDVALTMEKNCSPGISGPDAAKSGNLILIPQDMNSMLDTKPFSEKNRLPSAAADEGLYVDQDVLTAPSWTKTEIDKRSTEMARIAYENVWSIENLIVPGL